MMTELQINELLFRSASRKIPSAGNIVSSVIDGALLPYADDLSRVKEDFSALVERLQIEAYEKYKDAEARATVEAFEEVIRPRLSGNTADDVFAFLSNNPDALDRYYLSLTQSRRPRAGIAFEQIMKKLLEVLRYPYSFQPVLPDSKPDYVLPSLERYNQYAADCIILTCKRTLRERWRQIVTEGGTGTTFFLATIDDSISGAELHKMRDRRVVLVVPKSIKDKKYFQAPNVICFEDFFLHHLDPAMSRWQANGVV